MGRRIQCSARRVHNVWFVLTALLGACAPAWAAPAREGRTEEDFFKALRENDVGYVRDLLVNTDAKLCQAVSPQGVSALHTAAVLNNGELVALLLKYGADPNVRTEQGFTPLHWAASRDASDAVNALIAGGSDVNAASPKGLTPLHWAANRNATNAIRLLLAAGANPRAATTDGQHPIHWAHLGQREDAAFLLAERIVAVELESERTNVTQQAEAAEPPPPAPIPVEHEQFLADQTDIYITRTEADGDKPGGQALIVSIGLGQTLVFEWLRPLRVWAGKYEVTNGQFRRFRPSHTSRFREKFTLDGNDQPVVYVSWQDAVDFCEWLNRTYRDRLPKGFIFRLPYAVEWTLMARCGESRKYPWGNDWPPAYGNFADLTAREQLVEWSGITKYDDRSVVTCPVNQSGMNEWGIYGLAGNVWEWCEDWSTAERRYKVRRGGSWDFDTEPNLRINAIGYDRPDVRDDTIGFRVMACQER